MLYGIEMTKRTNFHTILSYFVSTNRINRTQEIIVFAV